MSLHPRLKSVLSGALGATLALMLLAGLAGARDSGRRGGEQAGPHPGFAKRVLRRLNQIDHHVRELREEVAALEPQLAQVQSDVSVLAQGGGSAGGASAPPQVFGLQICLKGGLSGEVGFSGEQVLKLDAEGRVGAEAYGNGVMAKIRALPGAKIGGGVKGDAGGELTACFDLRALAQRIRSNTAPFSLTPGQEQAVLRLDATDDATLAGKLLDFVALTGLDPAGMQPALDQIPQLAADVDPRSMARPGNAVTQLAQVVPLSFQARARLQDVNATFDTFQQQRGGLCTGSLPPALAGVIDPVCAAAASEPLKPAIENTAARVTEIRSRAIAIQSKLQNIPAQVRNALCAVLPGC